MKKIVIIILGFACVCLSPHANAEITQRLCAEADLAGTFKLVDLRETPKGEEAAWFQEYRNHYLIFRAGHAYDFVASRHAIKSSEDLQKAINAAASVGERVAERSYTFDSNGVLNLYLDGKLDYSYRCMIVIKAANGDQVGDLMLTGYSKKKTELYKLFRHWP